MNPMSLGRVRLAGSYSKYEANAREEAMNPRAGAAMLVMGGALAGCTEPEAWYSEPEPYRAGPVYGLQLGCSDCRSHHVQPHHHHHEPQAHHGDGKRRDDKSHDGKSHD